MLSRLNQATSEPKEGGAQGASLPLRAFAPPLAIFALALLVRLIGITWGLPNATRWYSYHPDESFQQIIGAVMGMMREGGFNPHFFNYPSLAIYATYFLYMVQSALGLNTPPQGEAPWNVFRDIILCGRLFAAFCGAGAAVLAYLTAKELRPGRWAILAGVLAALTPGLVQHSHFATVDVPATFFVALCLWLTVRAKDARGLLWAAAAAGLAAGTKYNGIIVLAAPVVAIFLLPHQSTGKRIALVPAFIALSLLTFLVTTPCALLSTQEFLGTGRFYGNGQNGFLYELLRHPKEGSGELFVNTGNGWWYHLTFTMPFAYTWPLLLAGIGGCVLARQERRFWPLLACAAIYFIAIGTSQVRFMRYTFLLAPVLCVSAAYVVTWAELKIKALGGLVAVAAAYATVNVLIPFVRIDSRDRAAEFLQGKPVVLAHAPWFYTPPIQPQGFNQPVPGLDIVGFDRAKIKSREPVFFVVSQYEWMETLRLEPEGPVAKFMEAGWTASDTQVFGGDGLSLALHGPGKEPTDYLYTHPSVSVFHFPLMKRTETVSQ